MIGRPKLKGKRQVRRIEGGIAGDGPTDTGEAFVYIIKALAEIHLMSIDCGSVLAGGPVENHVDGDVRCLVRRLRVRCLLRRGSQGDRVGDADLIDSDPTPATVKGIHDFDAHHLAGICG